VQLRSTYINPDLYLKQKNEIIGGIKDLKQFLYELAVSENTEYNILQQLKNDNFLENLNINTTEATKKINDAYKDVHQISKNLGVLQTEDIMGIKFEKTPLINLFNMENEQSIDHLKRLVLEVTVLAGIKVILSEINPQNKNLDLSLVRKDINNKDLPSTLNFESIPWLKSFYAERVSHFENIVKNDNSTFKIAPVIKEISNIGKELLKTKLFTASDFFARYGLNKEDEELLSLIGEMTEIGRMSLNIGFVTNFLSYLNHDENCPMTKEEIANIQLLIKYLNEKSKILDQNGKEIYAPLGNDQRLDQLYDKIKQDIGKRDFLALNTPLILNFIKKCYGQDVQPPRKIKEDSFEANNQVLSSWLFYILVKFLPEKSSDNDSLSARMQVSKIVLDQNFQKDNKVNPSLFKKMIKQTRGLSELGNFASTRGRKGIIKALCLDLENHINTYVSGNKSNIELKDVLNHYSELEITFKNNPRSFEKINEVQKNIFKANQEVLQPLENKLISLYENEPETVLSFIKSQKIINPHYKEKFTIDLLNKIDTELKTIPLRDITSIKDSDEAIIKKITSIIKDITNLGYILNEKGLSFIELDEKYFEKSQNKKEITQRITNLKRFLESKIQILEDSRYSQESEIFPNQYETVNELRILIQKLNMEYKLSTNKSENEEKFSKNYVIAA
jgi:hypothetical protein